MWKFILIPFCLQAIAIFFDEAYFHIKRGLPKWERIGHPLDTLSLLICVIMILAVPFSYAALKVYCGLAVFSCLMVTKDEFIHKHHCPASENWIHALLFLLHPITLAAAAIIWPVIHVKLDIDLTSWQLLWLDNPSALAGFIYCQAVMISLFFLYQVIFWNFVWKDTPVIQQ